ncbi:MAG: hypothetical protein NZM25_07775 [Leptospiraceae bacterium]|nr:hypothetical protein [Leptospiraceae bacterium]MDW8305498.1 hypothetical protein [Leptospiraceae bacterium]
MTTTNVCFDETHSCSACCGIYNLAFSAQELHQYLENNTKNFLSLDISKPENIVSFREKGESFLQKYVIRKDIYVCPFVGFVAEEKTGCLLHPTGSPHPQISLYTNPQNFSFYGESICQGYNCLSKERALPQIFQKPLPAQIYGRLVSRADILGCLREIQKRNQNFHPDTWVEQNYQAISSLTSTSFEPVILVEKLDDPEAELRKLLAWDKRSTE